MLGRSCLILASVDGRRKGLQEHTGPPIRDRVLSADVSLPRMGGRQFKPATLWDLELRVFTDEVYEARRGVRRILIVKLKCDTPQIKHQTGSAAVRDLAVLGLTVFAQFRSYVLLAGQGVEQRVIVRRHEDILGAMSRCLANNPSSVDQVRNSISFRRDAQEIKRLYDLLVDLACSVADQLEVDILDFEYWRVGFEGVQRLQFVSYVSDVVVEFLPAHMSGPDERYGIGVAVRVGNADIGGQLFNHAQ